MSDLPANYPIRRRATDTDRNNTVTELSAALSRGQLDITEFEERSSQACSARFVDELAPLLADVTITPDLLPYSSNSPDQHVEPHLSASKSTFNSQTATQAVARVRAQITGTPGGSSLSISVMGGAERKGNWVCPTNHTSLALMGGNALDLREALLESDHIHINAFAVMGGIDIIVPEGVRVICNGLGLMGGFGSTVDKSAIIQPGNLPADAPVVTVSGLALMGGVTVITKAR
ncbi:DUF1707 domain-containing protein [Corynebacterium callunae]|uniref:DUF1707 SHOCT-like domain-containing protein n=1 Tax=Corynebacterium callunae TaxID=1721 RepID=UPI003982D47A